MSTSDQNDGQDDNKEIIGIDEELVERDGMGMNHGSDGIDAASATEALSPLLPVSEAAVPSSSNNSDQSPVLLLLLQLLRNIPRVHQADLKSALDHMRWLMYLRPQVVYKTSHNEKRTENHWAAFFGLQVALLVIAGVAHLSAFRISVSNWIPFLLYNILLIWLGTGCIISSFCREIANRWLAVQQAEDCNELTQVEWFYAFEVHCSSFFVPFLLLYFLQLFMLPVILSEEMMSMVIANTLYTAAVSLYWYTTYAGYKALPFLSRTEVFLVPVAAVLLLYVVVLVGSPYGFGWNAARATARFFFL